MSRGIGARRRDPEGADGDRRVLIRIVISCVSLMLLKKRLSSSAPNSHALFKPARPTPTTAVPAAILLQVSGEQAAARSKRWAESRRQVREFPISCSLLPASCFLLFLRLLSGDLIDLAGEDGRDIENARLVVTDHISGSNQAV